MSKNAKLDEYARQIREKVKREAEERKTLVKGDWVTYGGMGIWGFGRIEDINEDKTTCTIRTSEDQRDFHWSHWTVQPYVTKRGSLREAAEEYYYYQAHCTDHRLSCGMRRDDFEFRLQREWPKAYTPYNEEGKCKACRRIAPLIDGKCPDCRHEEEEQQHA